MSDFVQRGRSLLAQKQYQEAVKVCRLGLLAHPTLVEGRVVLGSALLALGRHDEVLSEMRVSAELEPKNAQVHLLKGEALLRKGDFRQAMEVLERARELEPSGRAVGLIDEARRMKEAAGRAAAKLVAPGGFADAGETKTYPVHRGQQAAAAAHDVDPDPSSGRVTMPHTEAPGAAKPRPKRGATPPPEVLAVGDRSGAIEIDPSEAEEVEDSNPAMEIRSADIEEVAGPEDPTKIDPAVLAAPTRMVELDPRPAAIPEDEEDATVEEDDPVPTLERRERSEDYIVVNLGSDEHQLEPATQKRPVPTANAPSRGHGGFGAEGPTSIQTPSARRDRGDANLELTSPASPRSVLSGAGSAARVNVGRNLFLDDEELETTTPGPALRKPGRAPSRAAGAASPGPANRPSSPSPAPSSPAASAPTGLAPGRGSAGAAGPAAPALAATLPAPAPSKSQAPAPASAAANAKPRAASSSPGDAAPSKPASRAQPKKKDETPYRSPTPLQPATTPTAALNLELRAAPRAVRAEATERTPRATAADVRAPSRRFGVAASPRVLAIVAVIAAAAVAVALVGIGFFVQARRRDREIRRLTVQADQAAAEQTYRGYLRAESHYRTILAARRDEPTAQALARLRAAMAAEFGEVLDGDGDPGATAPAGAASDPAGGSDRDAQCARVYRALAAGDGAEAVRLAREAVARFAQDPEASYLLGRALLYDEDPAAAAVELSRSIKLRPTPLAYVALSSAEAAQGRPESALQALARALELVPSHPTAVIENARLLARTGRLPAPNLPEDDLAALLREAAQRDSSAVPLVSNAQIGWASLALAEVKLARRDEQGARKALAAAAESRPARDRRFSEALAFALLQAGDTAGARAEAERAVQAWPGQGGPRVWLARIALAERRPDVTLAELDKAGAAGSRGDALALRGHAKLLLGDIDGAARDLDAALAARPGDRAAILARAQVDLRKGEVRAGAARLEPIYAASSDDPDVAVLYGAALRHSGDRVRARQVLERAAKLPRPGDAHIELARLERDEGRFAEARDAYARAIEAAPTRVEARLEAATLAYDLGDATGARQALDKLVVDAPSDADVLLEGARIRTITGDREGAQKLVSEATRLPLAPRARLAREAGRLLLARGEAAEATKELSKAVAQARDDGEARLLYIDSLLASSGSDVGPAQSALVDVSKHFFGHPEVDLARGRVHLAKGEAAQAIAAFAAAEKVLRERKAPPRRVADALTWLGRAYDYQGDLKKAQGFFDQAARLDPSNAEALYYLGLMLQWTDKTASAHESFKRSTEVNPSYAEAWFSLGETGARLATPDGRETAKKALARYLELAPKGENAGTARNLLKRLR